MRQRDLLVLIDKFLEGKATEAEKELLHRYYCSFEQIDVWSETDLGNKAETEARILQRLTRAIQQMPARVIPLYKQIRVRMAAAIVLLLVSSWWLFHSENTATIAAVQRLKSRQSPTGRNTTLSLANGTVLVLDSAPNGILANHPDAIIRKQGTSISIEVPVKSGKASASGHHTLKTPNGQQYKVVLADGSQVWLNTASSIRFPVAFAADERRVEITGEAYFEVAKEAGRPFRVATITPEHPNKKGALIEVLGTHFNVNAYADEGVTKTTLLEGSVKVAVAQKSSRVQSNASVLLPGEQAQISSLDGVDETVVVKKADTDEVLAWKSNVFQFNNAGLQNIMRQLARWYDVDVVYANKVPARNFSGKISRSAPLSMVLEILEQSNIHFTIRGNQIIVKS